MTFLRRRRGTGQTTKQMNNAKQKAVFIWIHDRLDFPKRLAKSLNRDDLEIVGPSWLTDHRWEGRIFTQLILDHATELTHEQRHIYMMLKAERVR